MTLPKYPTDLPQGRDWMDLAFPQDYCAFEDTIESSARMGILEDRPAMESGIRDPQYEHLASAIGERLALLGYVDEASKTARTLFSRDQESFLQAVGTFQAEAGLTVDQWVGRKTWAALEYLVNFEASDVDYSDRLPPRLLKYDPKLRAVARAAKLRLHLLGLTSGRPSTRAPNASRRAISNFHETLKNLKILQRNPGESWTAKSIQLLLNHDGLIQAVAALPEDSLEKSYPRPRRIAGKIRRAKRDKQKPLKLFLVKLVRIELWLLGLDVDITSKHLYPIGQFEGSRPRKNPEADPLGRQIAEFYRRFREITDDDAVRERAGQIDQELFQAFVTLEPLHEEVVDEEAHKLLNEKLEAKLTEESQILEALDQGRSLGLQLWDGIKRLWRWIKHQVLRIVDVGLNLARAFYRYALKGFRVVCTAVRAVTQSLNRYLSGNLNFFGEHAANPPIQIRLKADFDMEIEVAPGCPLATVNMVGTRVKLFSSRFLFACRILSLVITGLKAAALSWAGWALLAKSLVQHVQELKPLYREIVAIEAQLA